MRKGLLVLFVIATMCIVVTVPSITAESSSDANETYQFYGKISHGSQPIESPNKLTIEIYKMDINEEKKVVGSYSGRLTDNGEFSLEAFINKEDSYYLSITEEGYTILSCPDCMIKTDKGYLLDFNNMRLEDNRYHITEDGHYITMCTSTGTVYGKVISSSGDNPNLNGVKITLTSTTGDKIWTGTTSGNGEFEITADSGTYTLTAENKGFEKYELDKVVSVNSGSKTPIGIIKMDPTNEMLSSHILTIAGIVASLILVLMIAVHIMRIKKKSKSSLE